MSFLKRLFGVGGDRVEAAPKAAEAIEYKGFTISAVPFQQGGQYQTCGVIRREVDGVLKEHKFIRADRFPSITDAVDVSLRKGQQLVDEQGDRMFG